MEISLNGIPDKRNVKSTLQRWIVWSGFQASIVLVVWYTLRAFGMVGFRREVPDQLKLYLFYAPKEFASAFFYEMEDLKVYGQTKKVSCLTPIRP